MNDKLIDQEWFLQGVNPSTAEKTYLQQNYEEVIRRVNLEIGKGIDMQTAVITVCKQMLGK